MLPEIKEARTDAAVPSPLEDLTSWTPPDSRIEQLQQATSAVTLALHHFDEMVPPGAFETRWLTKRGMSFDVLLKPWPLGAARVRFDAEGIAA